MKVLVLFVILISSLPALANKKGVGAILGNPTGLNGKYWLDNKTAIDGGGGFSFGNHTDFSLYSDYLYHRDGAFYFNDVYSLDLYYGVGGRMEFSDDIELGVRLPVGLAHMLEVKEADVFAEIAPVVDFIGKTGLEINLGFGARYYFQ